MLFAESISLLVIIAIVIKWQKREVKASYCPQSSLLRDLSLLTLKIPPLFLPHCHHYHVQSSLYMQSVVNLSTVF